jgi:hypothetical protein
VNRTFLMTPGFERLWASMGLGDDELRELEELLRSNPEAGTVIPGLSGARKVRIQLPNRGKSEGARVIYVDLVIQNEIYLLLAYPKNVQTDMTAEQKKFIRKLIETLKED